eukprot:6760109-Pyramimonas_sp.AAC.1
MEARRLEGIWESTSTPPTPFEADPSDAAQLPEISVEQFMRVTRMFSHKTSQTWDGFHPRHYGLLEPEQ